MKLFRGGGVITWKNNRHTCNQSLAGWCGLEVRHYWTTTRSSVPIRAPALVIIHIQTTGWPDLAERMRMKVL